ncbi:MAG: CBS domain-containing protein [Candidatus Dormibacteria bacterium]
MATAPGLAELAGGSGTRPVIEVMRHGVVLCDADMTVREVARAMRDNGVRAVLALDLSAEVVGLVDERDLMGAWTSADDTTAAQVMQDNPLVVDPRAPVGEAARQMLAAGSSRALVAPPPPSQESGRWSEWKERGLPIGILTVQDLLARADELEVTVRAPSARQPSVVTRATPWLVAASLAGALLLVVALVVVYTMSHPAVVHPGCAQPTQGGC